MGICYGDRRSAGHAAQHAELPVAKAGSRRDGEASGREREPQSEIRAHVTAAQPAALICRNTPLCTSTGLPMSAKPQRRLQNRRSERCSFTPLPSTKPFSADESYTTALFRHFKPDRRACSRRTGRTEGCSPVAGRIRAERGLFAPFLRRLKSNKKGQTTSTVA